MDKKKRINKSHSTRDRHSTKESSEQFDGPDTSSFKAFVFSFLSFSESSHRHADYHSTFTENEVELICKGPEEDGSKATARIGYDTNTESKEQCLIENDPKILDNNKCSCSQVQEIVFPTMSDTSRILHKALCEFLYLALPTIARGKPWVLMYSTWKHGISLLTLYRHSASILGPCLLVVMDNKGAVFGGLLCSPLKPSSNKKYQGNNETFVFTNVSGKPTLFRPTGVNRYFVLCTKDALALGGGGCFALRLDDDLLHGSTGPSETFGNCCLAHSEEFVVKHVELWGFSRTPRLSSRKTSPETLSCYSCSI